MLQANTLYPGRDDTHKYIHNSSDGKPRRGGKLAVLCCDQTSDRNKCRERAMAVIVQGPPKNTATSQTHSAP
uniref:Uncharacterized protein n=1 Tax=Anabas testudineus TaxID=64144 RepID=A0A7N6BCB4_ANATE